MDATKEHAAIVVLDIGSSSVKSYAFLEQRQGFVFSARRATGLLKDGTFEATAVFVAASLCLGDALLHLLGLGIPLADIQVSIACFVCSWVGIAGGGPEGAPLIVCTPVYCYANNSLSAATALLCESERCSHHDRVGSPLHPAYVPAFLRGQQAVNHAPAWASFPTYIISRLIGAKAVSSVGMSWSCAAWAGLTDWSTGAYDAGSLALAGLEAAQLPPLVQGAPLGVSTVGAVLRNMGHSAASLASPAGRDVPVTFQCVVGDGLAATVASTALCYASGGALPPPVPAAPPSEVVVAITVGTSAAARVLLPISVCLEALCRGHDDGATEQDAGHQQPPQQQKPGRGEASLEHAPAYACGCCGKLRLSQLGLWCYRVSATHCLLGGALTDGGAAAAHAARLCGPASAAAPLPGPQDAAVPPLLRPSRVLALPFWSGERSTGWQASARACFAGLGAETTSADMRQAAVEGVAFRLRAIVERLRVVLERGWPATVGGSSSGPEMVYALSGGAMADPLWAAVLSAVLACPVHVQEGELAAPGDDCPEVTSLGALLWMQTPESEGVCAAMPAAASKGRTVSAMASAHSAYERSYAAHTLLYDALAPVHSQLAALLR